jgi:hypothetical protein
MSDKLTPAQKKIRDIQKEALKAAFETLWRQLGGPALQPEYQFHPARKWRIDYFYSPAQVGIEIEGGTWSGGRHTSGAGYRNDCVKYNAAALMDIRVFRLTSDMLTQREGPEHLAPIIEFITGKSPT